MNKKKKKFRIGLVVNYLSSEYSESLVEGILKFCSEEDVEILFFPMGELKNRLHTYNYQNVSITALIRKNNLDGIIVASGTQLHGITKDDFLTYLKSFRPLKIVNISMALPKIPSVVVDCKGAYEEMLQYLLNVQKCKKIVLMGVDSNSDEVINRTQMFLSFLEKNHLETENAIRWKSNFEYAKTYQLLEEYFADGKEIDFDAIVALNDDMANACIMFFTENLHKKIPEDIIITGFDNLQRASLANPSITSVNQQVEMQGYKAAKNLLKILNKETVEDIDILKAKTILRQSTARDKEAQQNFESTKYLEKEASDDNYWKNIASEWFVKRSQLFKASQFHSQMRHNITLDELGEVVTDQLKYFGFNGVAVVLFDKQIETPEPFDYFTLPKKSYVVASYDLQHNLSYKTSGEKKYFDSSKKIIPDGYYEFTSQGSVIISLFQNEMQFGYIILRCGDFDIGVYDLVAKAISNQIASCYSYEKMIKEQSVIKDKYKTLDIMAHTDEMTGMKNRRGFFEIGQASMNFSEAMGLQGLMIYCDMDGLKKINDNYGHENGDLAIKAQAAILQKNFRSNDVVARLAGDEFAIVGPGLTVNTFFEIKKHIEDDCRKWSEDNETPFELSISLGYIEYPDEVYGYSLDELLTKADKSLYEEKRRKKEQMEKK